uniref:DNA-(apurinic or apyrimidinic site) endonuclease n=1 Tax=Phallusia mammillata TaxID=59560 RepID=A0A6F9D6E3_9ASCI|nr:DNA-(apurinic or apyrimidinic site) lyase-like [Phallusia mammillata]
MFGVNLLCIRTQHFHHYYCKLLLVTMPKRKITKKSETITEKAKKPKEETTKQKKPKKETETVEKKPDVEPEISAANGSGDATEIKTCSVDGRKSNLKISSWNVAGVRAWAKKNGVDWVAKDNADIVCLQETKCAEKEIPQELKDLKDYKIFWNVAKNTKGFSGVGLLSKVEPVKVDFGIGVKEHDQEGRTITAEYEKFYLVTTYVPNSQRKLMRLEYRMKWNKDFQSYLKKLDEIKPVILCGDLNVSHLEIDLKNPKSNKRNAGFTQEERDGMTALLEDGFFDSYRELYPDLTGKYTFWTYMANARAKNVGWRLDYFILSDRWKSNVCDNVIHASALGSDHCPISLLLAVPE